jgi:epoxyqueuosine reductase
METMLKEWAVKRGYRIAWAEPSVIGEIYHRFNALRESGEIDPDFYSRMFGFFRYPEAFNMENPGTVIIVAIPRPAHIVSFDYKGKTYDLLMPPTYHDYRGIFNQTLSDLSQWLGNKYRLELLNAPLKILSVMTGLSKYGKNNLVYVEGFGSYLQLVGFTTDEILSCSNEIPADVPVAMDECGSCRICTKICPTGAIPEERFLLKADTCLTYFSETENKDSLPEEFQQQLRPCLIGCIACQEVCPANKGLLRFERLGIHFTEDETREILGEMGNRVPSDATRAKVAAMKATELFIEKDRFNTILVRNASTVLKMLACI